MRLREQAAAPTLARRLGDIAHLSPLLRRVRRQSAVPEARVSEWLLKCAVGRGAKHYARDFPGDLPPDDPNLSDEELGVALCLAHHPHDLMLIRAAAQLLTSPKTNPQELAHLAIMERCEPILVWIADAAAQVDATLEPWAYLRAHLPRRRSVRADAMPHWSRFVSMTGYTPAGRGRQVSWLKRDE